MAQILAMRLLLHSQQCSLFVDAYLVMSSLLVFSQIGPHRLVGWLAQLPVCHLNIEEFHEVPFPRASELAGFSIFALFKLSAN